MSNLITVKPIDDALHPSSLALLTLSCSWSCSQLDVTLGSTADDDDHDAMWTFTLTFAGVPLADGAKLSLKEDSYKRSKSLRAWGKCAQVLKK